MSESRRRAGLWRRTTAALLLLPALTSTTGCSRRFAVVPGGENVSVPKATLDQLYSDNERLIQALTECQEKCR